MRLAVQLAGSLVPRVVRDFSRLPGFGAQLEAWGADHLLVVDHVLKGTAMAGHPGGVKSVPANPVPEPLATLAALAAVTRRVGLCTGIVIAAARNAPLLAKTAATVDALSGGRVILGIGPGWYEAEIVAMGVPFAERFARMDEAIQVCRALWSGKPASFAGRWTSFEDMLSLPSPANPDGIPVWIAGRPTGVTARRVAGLGEGWIASQGATRDDISRGVGLVAAAWREARRDPQQLTVVASLPRPRGEDAVAVAGRAELDERVEFARAAARDLAERGVTIATLPLAGYAADTGEAEYMVRALSLRMADIETATVH